MVPIGELLIGKNLLAQHYNLCVHVHIYNIIDINYLKFVVADTYLYKSNNTLINQFLVYPSEPIYPTKTWSSSLDY